MFIIFIVVMVSHVHTYVKTNQVVHFKYVVFTVFQLCFNKAVKNNLMIINFKKLLTQ